MTITISKKQIAAITIATLALVAYAVVGAVGGPSAANAAGPACVGTAVTSSVESISTDKPTVAEETSDQSTTKTVTKSHTHNEHGLVNVNDVSVKTGDIASDNEVNVLNDLVDVGDVNVSDVVDVNNVLNPKTNLLTGVLHVL